MAVYYSSWKSSVSVSVSEMNEKSMEMIGNSQYPTDFKLTGNFVTSTGVEE